MSSPKKIQTVKGSPNYSLVFGFFTGVVAFFSISVVVTRMGVDWIQVVVFSVLSGFCLGAFVYRERSLVYRAEQSERRRLAEVGVINARLEFLYMKSVACLVEFDASTRIIDRVSLGLFDLLGYGAEADLKGRFLEDVLNTEVESLQSLVAQIKRGEMGVQQEILCKRPSGESVKLFISANYLPEEQKIEAAFCLHKEVWESQGLEQQTQSDLERFRKGMVRREERILELKGEVNELLSKVGQSGRYKVDDRSDDTLYAAKANQEKGLFF
jgi:hypothetical protein